MNLGQNSNPILAQMQRASAGLGPSQTTPALMSLRSQLSPGFQQRVVGAAAGDDVISKYVQAVTGPAHLRASAMEELRSDIKSQLTQSMQEASSVASKLSADPGVRSAIRDVEGQAGRLAMVRGEPSEPLVIESMQKIQKLEEACRSAEAGGCVPVEEVEAPAPTMGLSCGCRSARAPVTPMAMRAGTMVMGADGKIDTPAQFVVYMLMRVFADMQLIIDKAKAVLEEEDVRLGRKTQAEVNNSNNAA